MNFGVRLPNSGPLAYAHNILNIARQAEEQGFHSVWVHDHIIWGTKQVTTHPTVGTHINHTNTNFFESITTLAMLSGVCQDINLGVAAIILPLRNPLILAKQLANIDVLSGSRLFVGVVPGAPVITLPEFDALKVDYHQRGRITDEYIQVLKKIWSENPSSFNGDYISFKDVEIMPKPLKGSIPILVGGGEKGLSEKALRRAIKWGDGWIPAYLTPEELRLGIKIISEGFVNRNRDGKPIVVHEMFICMADNREKALAMCRKNLERTFGNIEIGEMRSLIGTTETIISKLEQYCETGVDIVELKFLSPDIQSMSQMIERFAEEVAPSF